MELIDISCKSCNDCACISYTEDEQEEQKKLGIIVDHRCMKFNKRLFHYGTHKGYNGMIYPCSECNFDKFIKRQ